MARFGPRAFTHTSPANYVTPTMGGGCGGGFCLPSAWEETRAPEEPGLGFQSKAGPSTSLNCGSLGSPVVSMALASLCAKPAPVCFLQDHGGDSGVGITIW